MNISLFKDKWATDPLSETSVPEYLESIKCGEWQYEVLGYRKGQVEGSKLGRCTPAGVFTHRSDGGLSKLSGFIVLDIDCKDNPEYNVKLFYDSIKDWPYCYSRYLSKSGKGVAVWVKIKAGNFLESFLALEMEIMNRFHIVN